MNNAPHEGRPAVLEALKHQMGAACDQMAQAQTSLKAACDEFEDAINDPARTPDQLLRLESACRNAGMTAMRLTTGYLTALTAYSRALHPERHKPS